MAFVLFSWGGEKQMDHSTGYSMEDNDLWLTLDLSSPVQIQVSCCLQIFWKGFLFFFFFAWLGVGKNKPALLPMGRGGGGNVQVPPFSFFLHSYFRNQEEINSDYEAKI